ncbi:MAG: ABC transporter ATP-binding protein [Planctomycetota bacterium]
MAEPRQEPLPRPSLLDAQSLTVVRDGRDVVGGIDMSVAAGECVGVIGPNGSGKTSLLAALRGLLLHRGTLQLQGVPLSSYRRRDVARLVAVVPQRLEFAFPYTVEEMVLLGRTPFRRPWEGFHGDDRAAVQRVLERLQLAALAGERVDRLSGGERRKVFLARALVQETPLVFLDEPLAGLDPAAKSDLLHWIQELRGDGRGVIAVLHEVHVAAQLCDRVIGLGDGRQQWGGSPADVLQPERLEALFGVAWNEYRDTDGRSVLLPQRGREGDR